MMSSRTFENPIDEVHQAQLGHRETVTSAMADVVLGQDTSTREHSAIFPGTVSQSTRIIYNKVCNVGAQTNKARPHDIKGNDGLKGDDW